MDIAELVSICYFPTNDIRKQHESATSNPQPHPMSCSWFVHGAQPVPPASSPRRGLEMRADRSVNPASVGQSHNQIFRQPGKIHEKFEEKIFCGKAVKRPPYLVRPESHKWHRCTGPAEHATRVIVGKLKRHKTGKFL